MPKKVAVSTEPNWNIAELMFGSPVKISLETEQLPKEFGGHNFVALFAALEKAVKLLPKNIPPEQQYQLLKTKKLLGDLTIDDYFILKVQLNSDVNGYSPDLSKAFRAETFQLRPEKRIEASLDMFDGCHSIARADNPPTGNSPSDFIESIKDDSLWEKSYLLLNSVKPIYNRKNYKGKLDSVSSPDCRWRFVLPNPQSQYELAFTKPQLFELAESETAALSLKDYEYYPRNGVGVIAWHAKGEKLTIDENDWLTTLFVVKIQLPFVKSETLEETDKIENKKFKMFSRTFFVDIEGTWAVSWKTGKIIKKTGRAE